jgi:predicted ABC-type ATPase
VDEFPDDSLARHLNDDGELSFERTLLHASILGDLLDAQPLADRAQVLFSAGGPASGKSSLLKHLGLLDGAVRIDVDEIRQRLPEYPEWLDERPAQAAALTHREASQIAKLALAIGLQQPRAIIFDGVGGDDEGGFSEKIRSAIAAGATVRLCYATVSVDTALEREHARFADTGRHVDADIVRRKHAEASRGLAAVSHLEIERIEIYDTSSEAPLLIASGTGGRGLEGVHAVDAERYAAFLEKGHA